MRGWQKSLATCGSLVVAAVAADAWRGVEAGRAAAAFGDKRALVLLHDEWLTGAADAERAGRSCAEGPLVDAEIAALRRALAPQGYELTVMVARAPHDLVPEFDLVVHHNGGWGSRLTRAEAEVLRAARDARVPTLFLGDDVGGMLSRERDLAAWAGMAAFVHNGVMPTALGRGGDIGVPYAKEVDSLRLESPAGIRLTASDGSPAAWVAEGGVAVAGYSLRSSDVCPVSSPEGEALLAEVVAELVAAIAR